jgi:hypothetical protein
MGLAFTVKLQYETFATKMPFLQGWEKVSPSTWKSSNRSASGSPTSDWSTLPFPIITRKVPITSLNVISKLWRHEGGTMTEEKKESVKNYKGFVAGVFSGIAKLTGMSSILSPQALKKQASIQETFSIL